MGVRHVTNVRSSSECESVYLETLDIFSTREENESNIYRLANVVQGKNGPLPSPSDMEAKIMECGDFSEVHAFIWKGTVEFDCRGHVLFDLVPKGSSVPETYRPQPAGSADLPTVFTDLFERYEKGFNAFIRIEGREHFQIDTSEGHYLNSFDPLRQIEEALLRLSSQYFHDLSDVLIHDQNSAKRKAAAFALGWAEQKERAANMLNQAILDCDEGVRDAAARGLPLMMRFLRRANPLFEIEAAPSIRLFNQPRVLDRQKAAGLLYELCLDENRRPQIVELVKDRVKHMWRTRLYMHRRAVYPLIRFVLRDHPLSYSELTLWIREHAPQDFHWWSDWKHSFAHDFGIDG
jgi:hypothetical protein